MLAFVMSISSICNAILNLEAGLRAVAAVVFGHFEMPSAAKMVKSLADNSAKLLHWFLPSVPSIKIYCFVNYMNE